MKKLSTLIFLVFATSIINAQIAYQQGDNQLNFGINLGQGPGLWGSYEAGITDNISVGGELGIGFSTGSAAYLYTSYNYFQTNFRFSGFANYHFAQLVGIPDEWDLYGGLDIGYSVWTRSTNAPSDDFYGWKNNSFMIGVHGGGRWFWNEQWGVLAEIGGGYGYFLFKGGLTLKL